MYVFESNGIKSKTTTYKISPIFITKKYLTNPKQ
jgi:hypothetical protein